MDTVGDVLYGLEAGEDHTIAELYHAVEEDEHADPGLVTPLFYDEGYGGLADRDADLVDTDASYDTADGRVLIDADDLGNTIEEYERRIRHGETGDTRALRDRLYDAVRSEVSEQDTSALARQYRNAGGGGNGLLAAAAGASLELQSIANKPLGRYVDPETVDPALDIIGRGAMVLGAGMIGRATIGYSMRERARIGEELDQRRLDALREEHGDTLLRTG